MRVGMRRGYRRRANCASPGELVAADGRSGENRCPTWYGGQLCTGEDVEAWWLELESRASVVDSLESAGSPSAADAQRIAVFRGLREGASSQYVEALAASGNITAVASVLGHYAVKGIVDDLVSAIDSSYCVSQNWEGKGSGGGGSEWTPPVPPNGNGKKGTGGITKPSVPSGVLIFIGSALAGLIGFALLGGKGKR